MSEKRLVLLSVSDKSGLEVFARELHRTGFELVASGGTWKAIKEAGIPVKKVEDLTKFPEMLGGRVKTLHPKIHGGILADKSKKDHLRALKEHGIEPFDLVIVNLYPFRETVAKKSVSIEEAIENIDIGGPTLIRAAAKNHEHVAVITSPDQYFSVLADLKKNGSVSLEKRKELAQKAFELTAEYDTAISGFLRNKFLPGEKLPARLSIVLEKQQPLRYGENWHQEAALYRQPFSREAGIGDAKQLNGKEMGYNNFNDAFTAVQIASEFPEPAAAIIKHANPCGVASDRDISAAFSKALDCDRTSAFGSVIALNRECDSATAVQIASFFNEIVVAPSFEETALTVLKKKKNLRVLELPSLGKPSKETGLEFKSLGNGALVQSVDSKLLDEAALKVVSKRLPSETERADLLFAWAVAKHAKSNAIVLAKGSATVGIGAGQMSRIDSTEIAIKKSLGKCKGSALASDSFFPFRDNVDMAGKAGITAIIQPGGSVKDEDVIKAADEHKIAMLFTGMRHFKH